MYRVLDEAGSKKFGIGQNLYYNMPFFCDPAFIIKDWCLFMIDDYTVSKNYNIPIAKDLNKADAFTIDCFKVIEQEFQNIKTHEAK